MISAAGSRVLWFGSSGRRPRSFRPWEARRSSAGLSRLRRATQGLVAAVLGPAPEQLRSGQGVGVSAALGPTRWIFKPTGSEASRREGERPNRAALPAARSDCLRRVTGRLFPEHPPSPASFGDAGRLVSVGPNIRHNAGNGMANTADQAPHLGADADRSRVLPVGSADWTRTLVGSADCTRIANQLEAASLFTRGEAASY
jgi:hypothetical protein